MDPIQKWPLASLEIMVSYEFCIQKNEASHDQANFNFNKRILIQQPFLHGSIGKVVKST